MVKPYLKAVYAAALAGLGGLEIALVDEILTTGEIVRVVALTLGALSVVWAVPNENA